MGKLIYSITTSLDGFVADKNGNFDWAMPSEEVHAFVNDIVRNVGTSLTGTQHVRDHEDMGYHSNRGDKWTYGRAK